RGRLHISDSARTGLSGSALDDEHRGGRTDGRCRTRSQQRSIEKSLSVLAVSFVQAQGQVESPDSRRHPHTQRRRALLMSSSKFLGSESSAKYGTKSLPPSTV